MSLADFAALRPAGGFGLIMADPPWSYEMYSDKGYRKSPEAHYATMDLSAIKALPVSVLAADDCLLWLWAVGPQLPQALAVAEAWGFTFKTAGWWAKTTKTGKQAFGTGYILRNAGEPFLIATRGAPKCERCVRSTIIAELREHSRKPDQAFLAAERLLPHVRRIELFSRQERRGWAAWGDEAGKFGGARQARTSNGQPACAMPSVPIATGQPDRDVAICGRKTRQARTTDVQPASTPTAVPEATGPRSDSGGRSVAEGRLA